MVDATTDPLGEVTGHWNRLSRAERDRRAHRLIGVGLADARIDDPDAGCHRQYAALATPALAGDPVAFGWLAHSHRPLLLTRGRLLVDRDPSEWSGVCLEVLTASLTYARAQPPGPWLRRQVVQQTLPPARPYRAARARPLPGRTHLRSVAAARLRTPR
jgi:hypothetical protein